MCTSRLQNRHTKPAGRQSLQTFPSLPFSSRPFYLLEGSRPCTNFIELPSTVRFMSSTRLYLTFSLLWGTLPNLFRRITVLMETKSPNPSGITPLYRSWKSQSHCAMDQNGIDTLEVISFRRVSMSGGSRVSLRASCRGNGSPAARLWLNGQGERLGW